MKRKCLECGDLIQGRIDKKFCTDQCRNTFNNRQNSDATNFVRNINLILRKNRRILAEMNPTGKLKVHRDQLKDKGFNFNYFTNVYSTKAGKEYKYCYDQGFLEIEDNFYMLVIKQEYVD